MKALRLYWICALLGTCLMAPCWAENIRALVVEEVEVASDASFERTVALSLEEAAVLSLAGQTPFLEGIRVELVLSNELKRHFDSYALGIYTNLSPAPQSTIRAYTGERAFFQYLPYLNRIYIQIPVGRTLVGQTLPVGTYRLDAPLNRSDFPLLITMIPLAKGIPPSVADKKFYFSISAIVEKKGFANLILRYPGGLSGEPLRLFIDGAAVERPTGPLELGSGIHQLRIVSSAFKEVNTSFTVESGKTSQVRIDLEELISQLTIDAPAGTELFLDGEKISLNAFPMELSEGNHLVRAKIADQSISKKFVVQKGKHYHLSIIFDIIVNED